MYAKVKKKKTKEDLEREKLERSYKHKLKYDSIFKGKKEYTEEELDDYFDVNNMSVNPASVYHSTYDIKREEHDQKRQNYVYEMLKDEDKLNTEDKKITPSKENFNKYYSMLVDNMDIDEFSYSELFVELCDYFIKTEPKTKNQMKRYKKRLPEFLELLDVEHGIKITGELTKYIPSIKELNYIQELDEDLI